MNRVRKPRHFGPRPVDKEIWRRSSPFRAFLFEIIEENPRVFIWEIFAGDVRRAEVVALRRRLFRYLCFQRGWRPYYIAGRLGFNHTSIHYAINDQIKARRDARRSASHRKAVQAAACVA